MKRPTTFEYLLPQKQPKMPVYRWLYTSLRAQILDGRLRPGARIPSTRDFANQYRLARGTVVHAFDQLKSEGYLQGNVGSGTYVSRVLPDDLFKISKGSKPAATDKNCNYKIPKRRISDYVVRVKPLPMFAVRQSQAFRANLPALDLFPITLWAQITTRRLQKASTYLLLGCEPVGYEPLRDAIANYLNASRGVKCEAGQVLIVSGTQEALDLTARVLLNPGDFVCVENPGYPGAALVFSAAGAKISYLAVDDEGIQIPQRSLRKPRLVYVTPGHQFPMGTTMSLQRRLALLRWAERSGVLIFEDDYDSEFRFCGPPVPALQGLRNSNLVIFSGSFSKVLFPSLRLGYLVVPKDLVSLFAAAKSVINRYTALLEQAVLCDFIEQGHFARHLRRMRQIYAERLSVLLDSAHDQLSELLDISTVEAGLQTAGWLHRGLNAEDAAKAAANRGVEVIPLSRYCHGRLREQGLQLGFAAFNEHEIRRGVRELAIALESCIKKRKCD
jgi:GntR family transcriptional regulator / MocR family aminotransferase